ncbi:MAG: hypothetical protein DHS20C17_29900 [Cyclobacteriaceae bacterium]|nr:MAG: hypothetical protein DHS20C17_29900 [Cyclobacteriaceae bacterium]
MSQKVEVLFTRGCATTGIQITGYATRRLFMGLRKAEVTVLALVELVRILTLYLLFNSKTRNQAPQDSVEHLISVFLKLPC